MKKQKSIKIWFVIISILFFFLEINAQENKMIFEENFENNVLSEWEVINEVDGEADWFLDEGYLVQTSNIGEGQQRGTNIIKKNVLLDNFTLRSYIYSTDDDYIGIVFRYTDSDNYYKFVLSSQRSIIYLQRRINGTTKIIDKYTDSEWPFVGFEVTIMAYNDSLKVYLNDKLYLEATDNNLTSGSFGFSSCYNNGNFFDWVKIYETFKIPEVNNDISINRGPYIQNLSDSSVAILWGTNKNSLSLLEIGLDSSNYQIIDENLSTNNHKIEVSNLLDETKYYYRVKSGRIYSQWHSFTSFSKNPDSFSFLVYGDSQNNFVRHREIISHFDEHSFDFIAHLGDIVQRGARNDWNVELFDPLEKYMAEKPIFVSIGNHQLDSENFYKYFQMPNSEHENYFTFSHGNSFFVFFDNRSAAFPEADYYPSIKINSPQYIWLEEQLSSQEATEADWIFVFSHVPTYHNRSLSKYLDCEEYLAPLFEKYGVDFNFSGHLHGYERGFVNNVNYVTAAGGGGIGPVKDDGFTDPINPLTNYPFREIYNFCKVEVNSSELIFSAYDISGKKIDSKTIITTSVEMDRNNSSNSYTYNLSNAYPNPFNPTTVINFSLAEPGNVTLSVYDTLGQEVAQLVNKYQEAGNFNITFNASNLSSGVYFISIKAIGSSSKNSFTQVKKALLLK